MGIFRDFDFWGECDSAFIDEIDKPGDATFFEGTEAVDHFIEHNTQGPDIRFDGVNFAFEDFGSHVDGWSEHGLSEVFGVFHGFAEAKISEFDDSIVKEDIAGFDVTVHDIVFDEHFESREQLIKVPECLFFSELAFCLDFFLKSALITELIDEVVVVGSFEDLDEADDVGGVLDFRQGVDFVDGELLQLGTGLELLDLDHFYRHHLPCFLIERLVHFPELPRAHCSLQNVVLYFLAHFLFFSM